LVSRIDHDRYEAFNTAHLSKTGQTFLWWRDEPRLNPGWSESPTSVKSDQPLDGWSISFKVSHCLFISEEQTKGKCNPGGSLRQRLTVEAWELLRSTTSQHASNGLNGKPARSWIITRLLLFVEFPFKVVTQLLKVLAHRNPDTSGLDLVTVVPQGGPQNVGVPDVSP
jgi:hypothetical protein